MEGKSKKFVPEIVILYCQHCISDNGEAAIETTAAKSSVKTVMMPCSSKVEAPNVLKILEAGADGVEVVACPEKQCRFLVGSRKAEKRIDYAKGLLETIKMGAERLGITRKSGLNVKDLIAIAAKRADAVKPLGPNPMHPLG